MTEKTAEAGVKVSATLRKRRAERGWALRQPQGKRAQPLHCGRKRKFDLGAGFGIAPDAEGGADVGGSLAHDGEAPARLAAGVDGLRVDSGAVLAVGGTQFSGGTAGISL